MYQLGEISNRDLSLLYFYRILRQPSDFLSAIYSQGEPEAVTIRLGDTTDLETEDGNRIYAYKLDVDLDSAYIPYLEFDITNPKDKEQLATLLYLDGNILYGLCSEFQEPVYIHIYQVSSLEKIKEAISSYIEAIQALNIEALKEAFEDRKNKPTGMTTIAGNNNNLVQFADKDGKKVMEDSHYMIASALDGQMLVNPSQELLMTLPRKLRHSININITDGNPRYLDRFSGYSMNIQGNGDWVLRDIESGINFVSGSGSVRLWNCTLVHFRNSIIDDRSNVYNCKSLSAHKSLVVVNQGKIEDIILTGGSTLVNIPNNPVAAILEQRIQHISLIGSGCSLYSWSTPIPVSTADIHGLAWWNDIREGSSALYIAGRRIDEVSGEHDAELHPKDIVEYDVDNIHIHLGGG